MVNFLSNILSFPTILYTGLLVLVVLYWLTAIIGFVDFDGIETEIDVDASDVGGIATWLTKFKLEGIPFTLTLSMIIFISWILCFYLVELFIKHFEVEWVRIALGFLTIVLTPIIATPIVAIILSPLKPLLKKLKEENTSATASDFIGATGLIRSVKVNQSLGSAEVSDGGAGLILQIRADEPNDYQRGDHVILTKYLPDTHTYLIKKK